MSRVSTHVLRFGAAAATLSFLVSAGTVCESYSGACIAETTLRKYTGQPTVPCQPHHPVVQIDSQASCPDGTGGPVRVYRCGTSSAGFSYTGTDGTVHTFGTTSNWETVLAGNCGDITYSAS